MSQPSEYVRFKDYSDHQATNPQSVAVVGSDLDTDLDRIKTTTDELRTNIALIQRDDGKLRNSSVHPDALNSSVLNMLGDWTPRGPWVTATNFAAKDLAEYASENYVAVVAHTSGVFATDLAAGKWQKVNIKGDQGVQGNPGTNGTNGTNGSTGAPGANGTSVPTGRLSLASLTPVMGDTAYTAKTVLYYCHRIGNQIPIYGGAEFVPTVYPELSNDLSQTVTGNAGPTAVGPYQCIDVFVGLDSNGAPKLTRGRKWRKASTVTVTIATPGVVTWNSHGLYSGATFRFEATSGALPTGLAVLTDYFVTVIDANTFRLSTTLANQVAGTYIATSGSQSGTHTGANYTTARETGVSELERVNGLYVNKQAIATDTPVTLLAARFGTYVGTVYLDSAGQMNWLVGGAAVGGTPALLGVWNAFNRVQITGNVQDTTTSYTYSGSATVRQARAQSTMRAIWVCGLAEDEFDGLFATNWSCDSGLFDGIGVGFNSTAEFANGKPGFAINLNTAAWSQVEAKTSARAIGVNYFAALEKGNAGNTMTFQPALSGYGNYGLTIKGWF